VALSAAITLIADLDGLQERTEVVRLVVEK
jgi:hypothetical protein